MKKPLIMNELHNILIAIQSTNTLLDILIKKVSLSSHAPLPWLKKTEQAEAQKLRETNPETYDYICKILKLFFTEND